MYVNIIISYTYILQIEIETTNSNYMGGFQLEFVSYKPGYRSHDLL